MTQELVIKQVTAMTSLFLKKRIFKILPLLLLSAITITGFAQKVGNISNGLNIKQVIVSNESAYGKVNGFIEIIFTSQPEAGKYKISYDLHAPGNKFTQSGISLTGNRLIINNLRAGKYFNVSVQKEADGKIAAWNQSFTVAAANFSLAATGNGASAFGGDNTSNATCSASIN